MESNIYKQLQNQLVHDVTVYVKYSIWCDGFITTFSHCGHLVIDVHHHIWWLTSLRITLCLNDLHVII
jgi:hypothetical protein